MELLLLPLRRTNASPARIFGVLTPNYQPGWFGQVRAEPLDLLSMRVLAAEPFRVDVYKESGVQRVAPPPASRPTFVVHQGGKM
jgi:hypothetical protein